ncbi:MAG TPA: carboxypeptidase-like regulatory domain-containing protein, partial [Terriglobales bacterium]|nr:carboxypeptidase-like regulatory domain-containing protein [Terriglobales bacterium]
MKLIMVGLFSFVSITMWGQASTATLVGTVHDNSGAVVPGAEVSVTNAATGNSRSVKTGNAGEYSVTFLPVGTYNVQVKSTGFRPFEQKSVVLEVGRTARVDVSLTPGGASENITVTSEVPQINTTDASVGRTIENTEVNSLPLVNRSTYDFLTLT